MTTIKRILKKSKIGTSRKRLSYNLMRLKFKIILQMLIHSIFTIDDRKNVLMFLQLVFGSCTWVQNYEFKILTPRLKHVKLINNNLNSQN